MRTRLAPLDVPSTASFFCVRPVVSGIALAASLVFAPIGCSADGGSSLLPSSAIDGTDGGASGDAAGGGGGGDDGVGPGTDGGLTEAGAGGDAAAQGDGGGDASTASGTLPAKILGLYFFMYDSPRLATIQANAPQYNVVYYAFALGTNDGGHVSFSVPSQAGGDANFRTDIAAWKASGRVALLSVGGGSDTGLRLQNATQAADFLATITPVIDSYGFQGIDWDLEQSNAYDVATVVGISKQLKAKYGKKFVVSIVPRPYEFRSAAGSHPYRDIAAGLGADCDLIGFQFYDYNEANDAQQQMGIIQNDINDAVAAFPASKLLIGAEAPNAGLAWSPASVYRDAYKQMNTSTGGLRGAFIWDSPNEASSGWAFEKTVGPEVFKP